MDELWKLIEAEAEGIARYYAFLESDYAKQEPAIPVKQTVEKIIRDEIDHLNALRYLFDRLVRVKPSTAAAEFASQALNNYLDSKKLIK